MPLLGGEFDSAWWKWAWGKRHAQALHSHVVSGGPDRAERPTVGTLHEYQPEHDRIAVKVGAVPRVPDVWSVELADVISNWHACLDHIAWALVARGHGRVLVSPKKRRRDGLWRQITESDLARVYFPFASTRREFHRVRQTKLPGITRQDREIVSSYQPYKRRNGYWLDCTSLGSLGEISTASKHRTLQPVVTHPSWDEVGVPPYEVHDPHDCEVLGITIRTPSRMETGEDLAYVHIRTTGPNPNVKVSGHVPFEVRAEKVGRVDAWCMAVENVLLNLLTEFDFPPQTLVEFLRAGGLSHDGSLPHPG